MISEKLHKWLGLVANFVVPGSGTVIMGHYEIGILQLAIFISLILVLFANLPEVITSLLIFPIAADWIWAMISSVRELAH